MKKTSSKWTGSLDVFCFTYKQAMKSKTMIITFAIFCIVALISFPLLTWFGDGDDSYDVVDVDNLYVYEENIAIRDTVIEFLKTSTMFENVTFSKVDKEKVEDIKTNILPKENNKDVILSITCITDVNSDDFGIKYELYFSDESAVTQSTVDEMASYLSSNTSYLTYVNVGIEKDVAELLSQTVGYNTYALDANGNLVSDGITDTQYNINYALLMAGLLSITFASSYVASQIVTEKSSKVVEYLLTSIKPMAIITGKVFASIAVVLSLLASVAVSFLLSGVINAVIFMDGNGGFQLPTMLLDIFNSEVMAGANVLTIILALAIFVVGFIFYGYLGGVSGAMVSKVEELAEGTKLLTFSTIIGAYLALGLIMSSNIGGAGWGAFNYLVYFLPLSAPFIVPSYLLFGIISPVIGLSVIAINVVITIVLILFVSKIYEQLIYHNGNPLKIKDLFHLSKNKVKKND